MLRINQIKVRIEHDRDDIVKKASELLHISPKEILSFRIVRQSIDARKKPELFYIYSIEAEVKNESSIVKRFHGRESLVSRVEDRQYHFPKPGTVRQKHPTVVVGMGPAGLFCSYFLCSHGYPVILLERGKTVEERNRDVREFWTTGKLNPSSNVQFGEGGAGTFSDGKLNTLVKDKDGRNRAVLETLVKFGAKESILYEAKPHIGTDVLSNVVRNMRNEIIRLGGIVCFSSQMTDLIINNGQIAGVVINNEKKIECEQLVMAIGHSARDTFSMLYERKVPMEPKSFAVGFRVEHPQTMINESQYGMTDPGKLGAAPYKLTAKAKNKRAVYSFCMCPGGYVVNASSEQGKTAVNGMSYSDRNAKNANSAIIVSVSPEDFGSDHPLAGITFQRMLEERCYQLGGGKIPVQKYGDFKEAVLGVKGESFTGSIEPQNKGGHVWADLSGILPNECNLAFIDGMTSFGHQIDGFDRNDTVLSGVESRTSSPVRIGRDESLQACIRGLYPCGEGAGYAGGITSAAMDGIRVAEKIAESFSSSHI